MEALLRRTRWLSGLMAVLLVLTVVPLPAAHAGMITTEALATAQKQDPHARIQALLERKEVRDQLEAWGVDPADAKSRVAALSDAEAQKLADRMQQMPAGGTSILGAVLFVFIVLLITDILGYTDVFPFVKKTVQ
ncbi:MAG: PA2779 family protein [Ectothiorhodospiraceae bacterium]